MLCTVPEIRSETDSFFLSFWAIFCHFRILTTWKIKILTLKKTPGNIVILHISAINDNHMMYNSWDMERDGHSILSFWTVFCPFTPLWTQKIKVLKKWKNQFEDIIILQMVYHKWQSCDVWFLRYGVQRTAFCIILDRFLPFYPLTTQKIKILKKWKNHLEILSFYTGVT